MCGLVKHLFPARPDGYQVALLHSFCSIPSVAYSVSLIFSTHSLLFLYSFIFSQAIFFSHSLVLSSAQEHSHLTPKKKKKSPEPYLKNAPLPSSSRLAPQERIFCWKYLLRSTHLQTHLLLSARISSLSSAPPLKNQQQNHHPNNGLQLFPSPSSSSSIFSGVAFWLVYANHHLLPHQPPRRRHVARQDCSTDKKYDLQKKKKEKEKENKPIWGLQLYIYYFYKNIKLNFLKNMHTKKNLVVNGIPNHHSRT